MAERNKFDGEFNELFADAIGQLIFPPNYATILASDFLKIGDNFDIINVLFDLIRGITNKEDKQIMWADWAKALGQSLSPEKIQLVREAVDLRSKKTPDVEELREIFGQQIQSFVSYLLHEVDDEFAARVALQGALLRVARGLSQSQETTGIK
jgi:hypothetical protein